MSRLHAVVVCPAVVLAGAAAVSCAQLAGIDNTNGNARTGDSLVVTRLSISTTLDSTPLALDGLHATYLVANGVAVDRVDAATGKDPGTWTTKLHTPAPVVFTLPDVPMPIPRLFDFPSEKLQVLYGVLEHPNAVPAPEGATFKVTVPLDAAITANDSFQTYVVGAWLRRVFVSGEAPEGATQIGPLNYGFAAGNSLAGLPMPTRVAPRDAFFVLRYTGAALSGVAASPPVDQTAMETTVTTAAMLPVAPDLQLDVKLDPTSVANRYKTVLPAPQSTAPAMTWTLVAAPGYRTATNAGPTLHSGNVVPADIGVSVRYGNPFMARGWNTMFVLTTSESRTYSQPGTTLAISLLAGMNQFIEPSLGFGLTLPAGLPVRIYLDDLLLSTDGQMIKPPSKFVRVTFTTDLPGGTSASSATLYEVQLWDLVPNQAMPPTALDRHLVLAAVGSEASFDLPPELFLPGHSYTVRAVATLGGFPAMASGNFVMRELPLAQSYLDSGVITVTAVTP